MILMVISFQAVCEWGRESVESWGRKRRSVGSNETGEGEEQMNISQEILVLDFGDENKNSDYLRSDASAEFSDKTVTIIEPCATKTSVLALAITCALMVLLYIATMFVYFTKKWMQPHKIVN